MKMTAAQQLANSTFNPDRLFTPEELKQDFDILVDSLQTYHPALYRYTQKAVFDKRISQIKTKIDKPLRLTEFYKLVSSFMSLVGDIHTTVGLPNDYHDYLASKTVLLPIDVRIINNKIYVSSNNSYDSTIEEGTRILEINGRQASNIIRLMESCFSSDAANISFKTKKVEQQFAFHYQTVFGATETFKIKFQINGKQEKIKQISALSFSAIKENRKKRSQSFPLLHSLFIQPPFLGLSIDSAEKTALLTIQTFEDDVLAEAGTAFNSFVDSAFIKIERAGVSSLIIDIRSNEGGTSAHASYLYSYLTDNPFSFLNYMEASRKTFLRDVKQGIAYAYNSESKSFRTRDSSAVTKQPRFYGLSLQPPKSNSFSGKVLVLINGLTTSSASQFASLVKRNKRGLLVGEEAPGPLYGGSGREYIVLKLPNTGMVAVISKYIIGFEDLEDKKRDTSIFPDYQTTYSIQDRLHGVDEELKQAYQLLDDKKYYPEQ
jgi:hypothetical protein